MASTDDDSGVLGRVRLVRQSFTNDDLTLNEVSLVLLNSEAVEAQADGSGTSNPVVKRRKRASKQDSAVSGSKDGSGTSSPAVKSRKRASKKDAAASAVLDGSGTSSPAVKSRKRASKKDVAASAVLVAHALYPSVILPSTQVELQLLEAWEVPSKKNEDVSNTPVEVLSVDAGVLDDGRRQGVLTCDSASPTLETNKSVKTVKRRLLRQRVKARNDKAALFKEIKLKKGLVKGFPKPENQMCAFCRGGRHHRTVCLKRKKWWEEVKAKSEYEKLLAIAVCNEDGVILRPNEREFQDFLPYVGRAAKRYSHNNGGVKVLPPTKPRLSNKLVKKAKEIKKPTVTPFMQMYEKKAEGVYKDFNVDQSSEPLATFIAKGVEPSMYKVGFGMRDDGKSCWTDMYTKFDDLLQESRFSEHGVNKNGTLFVDAEHPWSLPNLRSTFSSYLKNPADVVPGINESQLLFGHALSHTGLHVEYLNLPSITFLHNGADKYWIIVPARYAERVRALLKHLFPEEFAECPRFDCHKSCVVMPQVLRINNIPFHCIRQQVGEYVVTFPGAYHMVVNAGQNIAEAINFVMPQWKQYIPQYECMCRDNGEPQAKARAAFHSHFVPSPDCEPIVDEQVCSNVGVDCAPATSSGDVLAADNATRDGPRDVSSVAVIATPKTDASLSIDTLTSVGVVEVDDGPQDSVNHGGSVPTWLSYSDIQLLEAGNPFNDNLIDYFLAVATREFSVKLPQTHVCSSHFFTKLLTSDGEEFGVNLLPKTDDRCKDVLDYSNTLIPVCTGNHWLLYHVAYDEKLPKVSLTMYDSIAKNYTAYKTVIGRVQAYVEKALRRRQRPEVVKLLCPIRTISVKVPTQSPGSQDCGAFLIYYAVKLLTCGNVEAILKLENESQKTMDYGSLTRGLLKRLFELLKDSSSILSAIIRQEKLDAIKRGFVDCSAAQLD